MDNKEIFKSLKNKGLKGNVISLYFLMLQESSTTDKEYITMSQNYICGLMGICRRTASYYMHILEDNGLIHRIKQGHGYLTHIYVLGICNNTIASEKGNVNTENEKTTKKKIKTHENAGDYSDKHSDQEQRVYKRDNLDVQNNAHEKLEVQNSAYLDVQKKLEVQKDTGSIIYITKGFNNKKINNNIYISNQSNQMKFKIPTEKKINNNYATSLSTNDLKAAFLQQIGELKHYPDNRELIDYMADIAVKVLSNKSGNIWVSGVNKPSDVVKSRIKQLTSQHIEYILLCLSRCTTEINNLSAYLLACMYNAPATIGLYNQSKINRSNYTRYSFNNFEQSNTDAQLDELEKLFMEELNGGIKK